MDQDQEIRSYVHLVQLPRADDALRMLRLVASAVKPIMRKHRWRVGELSEFYPDEETLMGLNYNRGQRICLRLRFFGNTTLFMGLDSVMDTMLHELCHNVHGPHNDAFHALWETLRDEHLTLSLSGYSGASFLSEGRRLGGSASAVPARERGRVLSRGGGGGVVAVAGRRLGGGTRPALPPTPEMRRAAAAEAAERRNRVLEGCGANTLDQTQIRDIGETVRRNGFKTQAEEDKANDVAIAQALAELMGEDRGPSRQRTSPASSSSGPANRNAPAARSRLLAMMEQQGSLRRRNENAAASSGSSGGSAGWACSVCTLHNPGGYLCCDACQSERKDIPVIDLT
ncbi:wlm [Akanthomyces lecanii RCEF 1005]|uniref:Wlm n=1 Tax=Akanthomyces lecanii RCEF 1005 TaxID=1081108 RepID=A0A168KHX2_CORDF|nr:wlm [Akanthomyces lecanii RCEF 1005]